jgi:Ca-activated chloride channel homolog
MTNDIKKGLEHLPQTAPPDMVWDNIERKLDEDKPRRAILWLRFTVGAAASVAVIACAWFLMGRMGEETNVANVLINTDTVNTQPQNVLKETDSIINNAVVIDTTRLQSKRISFIANDSKNNTVTTKLNVVSTNGCVTTSSATPIETNIAFLSVSPNVMAPSLSFAPPTTYNWDFGDGNISATSPIQLYYSSPGTYNIVPADPNRLNYTQSDNIGYLDDVENETQDYEDGFVENTNVESLTQSRNDEIIGIKGKYREVFFRGRRTKAIELHGDTVLWFSNPEPPSYESYAPLIENEYVSPFKEPLSTFSIDVDNASYSNTRRMVQAGQKPPKDAVRIEEFVNYFKYDYAAPKGEDPFNIYLETATCPWNKNTQVVAIGLQGKDVDRANLPASNLVFLIDVSGSMEEENKLPLVKKSLKLLVDQMGPKDRVAVVTYAGAAGLALPSTACSEKETIKVAIDNLDAGGSTAGGEGILLAYKVAGENLKKDGNNRIILVTDGDFNVGQSTDGDMETLIEQKRKEGIALTVCGFGMGNYKDSKMEILADKGNGNYYYIDNFKESKKVFVTDLVGTLFTIAKDVKIQVEFNPKFVKAYRLIGYENRKMPPQDFNDDTKDAGELGAGHTVTALYEIVPVGSLQNIEGFIDLKYQQPNNKPTLKDYGDELLTVKLRYKKPDSETSKLLERTLTNSSQGYDKASQSLRFACGVTAYAMLLRDSKFKGEASYTLAKQLLESTTLNIENGYRDELLQLISQTEKLSQ